MKMVHALILIIMLYLMMENALNEKNYILIGLNDLYTEIFLKICKSLNSVDLKYCKKIDKVAKNESRILFKY